MYWWVIRRINNLKEWVGATSYPDLKEFVYLDKTALISLLSSTTGGVTQQKTTSQNERISSSITGSLGTIGASVGAEEQKSTETVQRYVIQSNFKEFYEIRKDSLALSDHIDSQPKIDIAAAENIDIGSLSEDRSAETQELERGNLVELDATLRSSKIYEYSQVFDAFEEIVESFSSEKQFQRQLQQQDISSDEITMILELMDILMAGLIPIECGVSNYGVYGDNNKIIVSKDWANKHDISIDGFYLSGFIDERNLWQEPSRILFGENEFTIYGRLNSTSPGVDWSPLKLVDILGSVFPDMAENLENFPSEIEDSDDSGGTTIMSAETIRDYIEYLESEANNEFPEGGGDTVTDMIGESLVVESHESKENALQQVESTLIDEVLTAELSEYGLTDIPLMRSEFLETSGQYSADWSGALDVDENSEKIHLDTNFIAIYW